MEGLDALDPPELAAVAAQVGTPVQADGRSAIALDDPDRIHVVVKGVVDVFAVAGAEGGEGRSSGRTYLFTLREGEALFGIPPDPLIATRLIAVGNVHTRVVALAFAAADGPGARDPFGRAVDAWIDRLSEAVAALVAPRPRVPSRIAPGEPLTDAVDRRVGADGGTVWVMEPGSLLFADTDDLEPSSVFPLSPAAWVTPLERGTRRTVATAEALERGIVREGLAHFHRIALPAIGTNLSLEAADELNRIREASVRDAERVRGALGRIPSLLGRRREAARATSGDAAWRAVARVSEWLGRPAPEPLTGIDRDLHGEARLLAIVRSAGLAWRRVRLDERLLGGDGHAIIAAERDGRIVSLVPERRGSYRVFDPATGVTSPLTPGRLGGLRQGAIALYPTLRGERARARDILTMAFRRVSGDVRSILLFGLVAGLLGLVPPQVTGTLVGTAIPNSEQRLVTELALVLAAVSVAVSLVVLLQAAALRRVETLLETDIQAAIWDRVLALPVSFFREREAGDLADRILSVALIRDLVSGGLVQTVIAGAFASVNFVLMLVYSPVLTAAAMAVTLLATGILVAVNLTVLRRTRRAVGETGELLAEGLQYIEAIATLRSTGSEDRAFTRWIERFVAITRVEMQGSALSNALIVFGAALPIVAATAFFVLMGFVLAPPPPLGTFVAFNAAFGGFLAGFLAIAVLASRLVSILVSWERLEPVRTAVPEAVPGSLPVAPLSGGIEVSRLTFRYLPDGPPVLEEVDFAVPPGGFVAFVGASGSGKSTLLRLMLAFERPEAGGIFYDRQDLSVLDAAALRRQVGVVLQNGAIFEGTVFDNIAAGRPVDMVAAREAARAAGLLDEIDAMPAGMGTMLSRQASLSGGQRQRLMIARALAGDPRILFLDEATSALDNVTQARISEALSRMRLTRIVIAHRLSTIRQADTIHVLDQGRIVESGNYEALMARRGAFHALASRQAVD